jgi:hypothetical protein
MKGKTEIEHLEKVVKMVRAFLKKHGGWNNGFETYIYGVVSPESFCTLNWMTPDAKKSMTTLQMEECSDELYNEIYHYLGKNNLRAIEISSFDRDGVWKTSVSFLPLQLEVRLI